MSSKTRRLLPLRPTRSTFPSTPQKLVPSRSSSSTRRTPSPSDRISSRWSLVVLPLVAVELRRRPSQNQRSPLQTSRRLPLNLKAPRRRKLPSKRRSQSLLPSKSQSPPPSKSQSQSPSKRRRPSQRRSRPLAAVRSVAYVKPYLAYSNRITHNPTGQDEPHAPPYRRAS